jgi:hypothetical protein
MRMPIQKKRKLPISKPSEFETTTADRLQQQLGIQSGDVRHDLREQQPEVLDALPRESTRRMTVEPFAFASSRPTETTSLSLCAAMSFFVPTMIQR